MTQRIVSAVDHGLHREDVDANAIDVVERLCEAGYEAFLVGGCVRDLLLGKHPKDFDVATNATPEEVRQIFRRSRLIGRRFQIVHVRYGRHLIEVSTFRKAHGDPEEDDDRLHADSGLILRDNVWGTLEDDATRRDFTINALYYDPVDEAIRDFVNGLEDLESQRLRFIGDPLTRLREDPVRILRAIRFHAKLGFAIEPEIVASIPECADHLSAIPPARLFDEACKLLMSGTSEAIWRYIAPTRLRRALFPYTSPDDPLVLLAMRNTDARVAEDKPVTPGFLLAVLLWRDYLDRCSTFAGRHAPSEARAIAAGESLAAEHSVMTLPRRFSQFVRDVWALQPRLETIRPKSTRSLLEHPRFRAAYDFLVLRAETGEPVAEQAQWWTALQAAGTADQEWMIAEASTRFPSQDPAKRRRRRRRKPASPSFEEG